MVKFLKKTLKRTFLSRDAFKQILSQKIIVQYSFTYELYNVMIDA